MKLKFIQNMYCHMFKICMPMILRSSDLYCCVRTMTLRTSFLVLSWWTRIRASCGSFTSAVMIPVSSFSLLVIIVIATFRSHHPHIVVITEIKMKNEKLGRALNNNADCLKLVTQTLFCFCFLRFHDGIKSGLFF